MAQYLMSEDGATFAMACFAALSVLAFLCTPGDRRAARERAAKQGMMTPEQASAMWRRHWERT